MRGNTAFAIVLCAALYGFGATTAYNAAFDEGKPNYYEAKVVYKHISSGKSKTYYLTLAPWGPFQKQTDASVSSEYYERIPVDATVPVYLMPGRLGIAWHTVGD
jgi:hypothetical protein